MDSSLTGCFPDSVIEEEADMGGEAYSDMNSKSRRVLDKDRRKKDQVVQVSHLFCYNFVIKSP